MDKIKINGTFFIRVWKPLPSKCILKNLEGKSERESPKRTISTSGGLGLLQMVSELDTALLSTKGGGHQARWAPKGGGL